MSTPVSTGPVTAAGKAESASNAITHGLSSEIHLVRREDATDFEALTTELDKDLQPATALEKILVKEITRASWRLELCGRAEDAATDDSIQPAIDRARASALNIILKATAELRRLQTNRRIALEVFPEGTNLCGRGVVNEKEVISALANHERRLTTERKYPSPDSSFCKTAEPPAKPPIPRNAPCPCGAKKKYKQCCGKGAPPVLHHGSKKPLPSAA